MKYILFCVCVLFQVIRYRNELMHSCELRVKDEWMRRYQVSLKNFVRLFGHVPQMTTVGKQMDEVSVFARLSAVVHHSVEKYQLTLVLKFV